MEREKNLLVLLVYYRLQTGLKIKLKLTKKKLYDFHYLLLI